MALLQLPKIYDEEGISPELQAQIRQEQLRMIQPELDILGRQRELTGQQETLGREQAQRSLQEILGQISGGETQASRIYEDLAKSIQESAQKKRIGFEERQNVLGLLRSGMTAAGLGDIQKGAFEQETRASQDRANRLAQLALERVKAQQGYQSGLQELGLSRAQRETQLAQAETGLRRGAEQGTQETISGYLTNLRQALNERQKLQATQVQEQQRQQFEDLKYQRELEKAGLDRQLEEMRLRTTQTRNITSQRSSKQEYRNAYSQALAAVEDADVLNNPDRDRLLSDEEIGAAQEQIKFIADQYGIDPNDLWQRIINEYGFQRWTPETFGPFQQYQRITKEPKKSSSDEYDSL